MFTVLLVGAATSYSQQLTGKLSHSGVIIDHDYRIFSNQRRQHGTYLKYTSYRATPM